MTLPLFAASPPPNTPLCSFIFITFCPCFVRTNEIYAFPMPDSRRCSLVRLATGISKEILWILPSETNKHACTSYYSLMTLTQTFNPVPEFVAVIFECFNSQASCVLEEACVCPTLLGQ